MKRPSLIMTGVLGTAGLATVVFGASAIHAAGVTGTGEGSLVQKIAQKFNLNQNEVQQVFDQSKQERAAAREAQFKTMLDKVVSAGTLTQNQENMILAKQQEVKSFMATLSGKSSQEKKTAIQTEMQQVQQWAKSNGIPEDYLHLGLNPRHRGISHGQLKASPPAGG